MSLIQVRNLCFTYDGSFEPVFDHSSFQIDTDWRLGFIGRNGRGKTTFLRLLMGELEYSGEISASVAFDYFPFAIADITKETTELLEAVAPQAESWELMRELNLLEVPDDVLYRPFETLSPGERTKCMLAALFCKENRFLLIDEPTDHLDIHAREVVSDYLRSKRGFILVSHDRAFLDGCIDHVLSINRADIEIQQGNYSSWRENRDRQEQFELAANERLKQDIHRLTESSRRTAGWSDKVEAGKKGGSADFVDRGYIGHKSAKMMQRAKSIEQRRNAAIEDKGKLLKNIEQADSLKLSPLKYHSHRLLELRGVALSYDERVICSGISFAVTQGDRIALRGRNGSGKSSLLHRIAESAGVDTGMTLPRVSGLLELGSRLIVSYVSQDTSRLHGTLSDYAEANGVDESRLLTILRKLDFSRSQFEKPIESYSSGQKKKVLLARSLCQQAHLYIWDEPLNYIDVLSRVQIEELLLEYQPTMLFVEHDRVFCDTVANTVVEL